METLIILGFPGTGKSTFTKTTNLRVSDSDSSLFSWKDISKKERHPDWPNNYKKHIKSLIGDVDIIFVSTHSEVREMLRSDKLLAKRCITVIPDGEDFELYMDNYKNRGNDKSFLDLMSKNWYNFRRDTFENGVGRRRILRSGEFINEEFVRIFWLKEIKNGAIN